MARQLSKSEESQKRVLGAAARIFRDNGYAGTTMRAVADAAGLKAGSIYYHYKSKDELIAAMLDLGIKSVISSVESTLEELGDDASARDQIECAIRAHISAIIAHGDFTLAARRVFGQVPEEIRAENLRLRDRYGAIWQGILENAKASGELRQNANITLARLFILGALNWTAEWFNPKGGRSIDEVAREFGQIVCSGLFAEATVAQPTAPAH